MQPSGTSSELVSQVHQANQHQMHWYWSTSQQHHRRGKLPPCLSQVPKSQSSKSKAQVSGRHLQPATATRPVRLRRRWQDGRQNAGRRPRIARVDQSHRFPTEALPSDHPPRRPLLLLCCADLPRLPLPGPSLPSRRGGSLGVRAWIWTTLCLVAPGCALHGRPLRALLVGWFGCLHCRRPSRLLCCRPVHHALA